MDALLFQPLLAVPDADPFGPEPEPIPAGAPLDLAGVAALLRSGFGGRALRVQLCVPGRPAAPLVLCCGPAGWTLVRPGLEGAQPETLAVIPAADLAGTLTPIGA